MMEDDRVGEKTETEKRDVIVVGLEKPQRKREEKKKKGERKGQRDHNRTIDCKQWWR